MPSSSSGSEADKSSGSLAEDPSAAVESSVTSESAPALFSVSSSAVCVPDSTAASSSYEDPSESDTAASVSFPLLSVSAAFSSAAVSVSVRSCAYTGIVPAAAFEVTITKVNTIAIHRLLLSIFCPSRLSFIDVSLRKLLHRVHAAGFTPVPAAHSKV